MSQRTKNEKRKKMTIKTFEELKSWQSARELADKAFKIYNREPFSKDFALKDQLNRSTGSIMDNIAEGFGRLGNKEFINFLTYSKGSCLEAKSQLIRAHDRNYISTEELAELKEKIERIDNLIGGLISYLKTTDYKGQKFKKNSSQKITP